MNKLANISAQEIQIIVPVFVVILLLYFFGKYLFQYRFPAKKVQKRLQEQVKKIQAIKKLPSSERRAAISEIFISSTLEHCWNEFQETLHDQTELRDGQVYVVRTRATSPASHYFGAQKVIETPLKTEYFKHLPGILTGIGIIGTFAGLLIGLNYFDPSDPAHVQDSLKLLLSGVRDAFVASFLAISSAMYVTNSEKKHLRICLENLEKLTDAIDSLFDAGVGEEYLAELVRHTQESSVQTRMLKDSLVKDLREMLHNLVDSQVSENLKLASSLSESYKSASKDMAIEISTSIEKSFRDPLEQIAKSVQSATGDQSGKVQSLLQDVLVAFMQKLETTFGSQFGGMQEMLRESIGSMRNMQDAFSSLVEDMKLSSETAGRSSQEQLKKTLDDMQSSQAIMQASMNEMIGSLQLAVSNIGSQGEQAGSKMSEQLEKIFADSESRQKTMADQMQSFVDTLKDTVGKGHQDTMQNISESTNQFGNQIEKMLSKFEQNRQTMDEASENSQNKLHTGTKVLFEQLNGQVKELLEAVQRGHESTNQTVKLLGEQTERNLIGMQNGAEKMRLAASEFTTAGTGVSQATNAAAGLVGQIQGTATELGSASTKLSNMLSDYRENRDSLQKSIGVIESIIANAQAEAGMRGQVLSDLSAYSDRMRLVNDETRDYLDKISNVLGNSFERFDAGIDKTLSKSLLSFDTELDKAIKALGGGVQELSENVDTIGDLVQKAIRYNQ